MTAFYMFRMLFMTFYGESHVDHHTEQHIHESPRSMTVPLMVLAVGSVVAGWVGIRMAWRIDIIGTGWNRFSSPFRSQLKQREPHTSARA